MARILIVEDDLDVVNSLKERLREERTGRLTIDTAFTKREAQDLLARRKFDLLILVIRLTPHNDSFGLEVLAEIRKIMSLTGNRTVSLKVFSDWVLHHELTYRNTITYFSSKFEPHIDLNATSKEVSKVILSNQRDFLKLNELKTELDRFLKLHKLPTDIIDNNSNWIRFITLLLEVLKDCPVKINSSKIENLTITEDKNGINCYRFKLRISLSDKKDIIKIKIKIK